MRGVELGQFWLGTGTPFAAMVPEDGRKRPLPFWYTKEALQRSAGTGSRILAWHWPESVPTRKRQKQPAGLQRGPTFSCAGDYSPFFSLVMPL
jgi:hypothetical protein